MRKMKKINGYLVVKFNDRELREWDGTALGNYGVIDAELYTGILEVDRGVMEYDDAETLEIAVELARGLEAELDVDEPAVKVTIVTETDRESTEAEVNPQLIVNAWKTTLGKQIESGHYPDVNPTTARHELHGFKVALNQLGVLDFAECFVPEDAFGGDPESPLPRGPEERELRIRSAAHGELNGLVERLRHAENFQTRRISSAEARAYLRALETSRMVTKAESTAFAAAIVAAVEAGHAVPPREQFENLAPELKSLAARTVYALGLALSGDCPENDCRVYLNTFNMAREVDAALDDAQGHAADTLRRELHKLYRELWEMYRHNYAVKKFKEGM